MSINFNRALFSVFVVMNYLGWQASGSPKPDLALLKGNTSLASKYTAALCVVFGAAMLLDLDGLYWVVPMCARKWAYCASVLP